MKHVVHGKKLVLAAIASVILLAGPPVHAQQGFVNPAPEIQAPPLPDANESPGANARSFEHTYSTVLDSAPPGDPNTATSGKDAVMGGLGGLGYPSSTVSGTD